MTPNQNSSQGTTKPRTRLFEFTAREEACMNRAIEASKRYMNKFGQGSRPYMIDYSHYIV